MRRREFITLLGGATVWPLRAQPQEAKAAKVGILVLGNPPPEPFMRAFREGLQKLGYIDGKTIQLHFRSAERKIELLQPLAIELVSLKVDVIVAYLTQPAQAAKRATNEVPIVMAPAGDPVGTGLIASLARPGGNVTGLSGTAAELSAKLLELIRETLPSAHRVAVLANAADPFTIPFLEQTRRAAQTVGIAMESTMMHATDDFDATFDDLRRKKADAFIIQGSLLRKEAADLALKHRIPSFSPSALWPPAGGLMSYAANFTELYREAAVYVDKILKGAKPADLPVAQPTKFELVINLKTAKALGLNVPPTIIARADEVIE